MSGVRVEQGITREAVGALTLGRGEPDWLRERRLDAWETFESVPWPDGSQDEWRRVDLSGLNLGALRPYAAESEGDGGLPDWLDPLDAGGAGGWVVQRNSEGVRAWLSQEAGRRGIHFMSLDQAVRALPEHGVSRSSTSASSLRRTSTSRSCDPYPAFSARTVRRPTGTFASVRAPVPLSTLSR